MAAQYLNIINRIRDRVSTFFAGIQDTYTPAIPREGNEVEVSAFVHSLWEDARNHYEAQFQRTKHMRITGSAGMAYGTPKLFWEACEKMEAGNHWEVIGRRNVDQVNAWKQELVDNETGDQIRARVAHLTSNWHDVTVSPNIANISTIFDQERKATGWSRNIREITKRALTYGSVDVMSVLDRSVDERGLATEKVCKQGSVLYSPGALSKRKSDGCWYAVHVETVTDKWVQEHYPIYFKKINTSAQVSSALKTLTQDTRQPEYSHTKLFDKICVYLDDDTLEQIPFDEEEFRERTVRALTGESVEPVETDNHVRYIRAWSDFLEERVQHAKRLSDRGELTAEDEIWLEQLFKVVEEQILAHEQFKATHRYGGDKRPKYPHGRYIVDIAGIVVEDTPNPYQFDWRHLFHRMYNEHVPERLDGRGDVEILWQRNKLIDQALSRYADAAYLNGMPKPWLSIEDKKIIDEHGYTTDPTVPAYYAGQPPQFPKGQVPREYLDLYNIMKSSATKASGVTEVTYGKPPTKQASGTLANILLTQNEVMVTGEANHNLNDLIEELIETRILMYRQFYTEPRLYVIDGRLQAVTLSRLLSVQTIQDENGQEIEVEIPKLEISVRPQSNFPQKWEHTLSLLLELSRNTGPDGMPLIPQEMILDLIAERFPSLSRNGEYRRISQATAIGLQVMQQEEAQKQEAEKMLRSVAQKAQRRQLDELLQQQIQTEESFV